MRFGWSRSGVAFSLSRSATILVATSILLFPVGPASAAAMPRRPNVIFVLVDDLGWADVGYNGSELATPNIDALAARSIRLERAYAYPVCSPTRAALMTGRNPLQFGIDDAMENDSMLPRQLMLLPEYFRRAGYATWMVGKWHLGMGQVAAMPQSRGFDYFFGHLGGFVDFYTHVYFGGLDWQRHGKSVREEGYATDLLTRDAVRLLTEHDQRQPFLLYLAYNAPHTPLQYPPAPANAYDSIQDPDRRVFAQMTTHLDAAIGTLVATLDRLGLRDDTLVVFMSDNGGNLEAGASNGGLRGGKGSAYEGGIRVPALISWPRKVAGGRSSRAPLFAQDWLPTLLDAAEIPFSADAFEGRSVWSAVARKKSRQLREPVVVGVRGSKAVFEGRWKLVRDGATSDRLYDVETDPTESRDRAGQFPDVVRKLSARIDSLPPIVSKGARGPKPETLFRDSSGRFDYGIRMPETREPWAEAASP